MNGATPIRVTFTRGAKNPLELTVEELPLEDLTEHFSDFEVGEKADALAIIPGEMVPCPPECRNHLKAKTSRGTIDCHGSRLHRLAANIVSIILLGIDADDWSQAQRDACLSQIQARGYTYWAYSTWSYDPPASANSRIFIPFSRAVPIESPRQWRDQLWPEAFRLVGLAELASAADPACKDASRLYLLPQKKSESSPAFAKHFEGRPIDVDELLRAVAAPKVRMVTAAELSRKNNERAQPADPGAVPLDPLRSLMRRYCHDQRKSEQRRDLVRRALAGEQLAQEGARDTSIHRLISTLAFLFPVNTPKEVVLEIIRPSIASLPGDPPQNGSWMEIAAENWERATAARNQADAEKAARHAAIHAKFFSVRVPPPPR